MQKRKIATHILSRVLNPDSPTRHVNVKTIKVSIDLFVTTHQKDVIVLHSNKKGRTLYQIHGKTFLWIVFTSKVHELYTIRAHIFTIQGGTLLLTFFLQTMTII